MEAAKEVGVSQNIDLNSGRTFWFAVLNFKDVSSRDKMIELVRNQAKYGFEHEKGTLKYACFTSEDNPKNPVLWVIEEYINGEAIHFHATADRMKILFRYIASGVMCSPLKKTVVEFFDRLEILKPTVPQFPQHLMHISETRYRARPDSESLSVWSDIVAIAKEDSDTLFFGVGSDAQDDTKLVTISAYTSKGVFLDREVKIHAALKKIMAQKGEIGNRQSVLLRLEAGFMFKNGLDKLHNDKDLPAKEQIQKASSNKNSSQHKSTGLVADM